MQFSEIVNDKYTTLFVLFMVILTSTWVSRTYRNGGFSQWVAPSEGYASGSIEGFSGNQNYNSDGTIIGQSNNNSKANVRPTSTSTSTSVSTAPVTKPDNRVSRQGQGQGPQIVKASTQNRGQSTVGGQPQLPLPPPPPIMGCQNQVPPMLQGQGQSPQNQYQLQNTQSHGQLQSAQMQESQAQSQLQAGTASTAMVAPIGTPPPTAAGSQTVASNAMDVQPSQVPVSYYYTTNNYIMDEKSDLSILNPSKGTIGSTNSVAPYEPKISV
jgi:hypothetical protein